jgi:hypothetical protein
MSSSTTAIHIPSYNPPYLNSSPVTTNSIATTQPLLLKTRPHAIRTPPPPKKKKKTIWNTINQIEEKSSEERGGTTNDTDDGLTRE